MTGKHDMGAPTLSTLTAQGGDEDIRIRKMRDGGWQVRFGRGAIPEVYKTALEAARDVVRELGKDEPAAQGGDAVLKPIDCAHSHSEIQYGVRICTQCKEYVFPDTTPPAPSSSAVDVEWALSVLDREIAASGAQSFEQPVSDLMKLRRQIKALASTAASGGEISKFHAWVKSQGGSVIQREGHYIESMTRLWWDCWQAATSANRAGAGND